MRQSICVLFVDQISANTYRSQNSVAATVFCLSSCEAAAYDAAFCICLLADHHRLQPRFASHVFASAAKATVMRRLEYDNGGDRGILLQHCGCFLFRVWDWCKRCCKQVKAIWCCPARSPSIIQPGECCSFGTSVGSGALTLRRAVLIATVCEFSGAVTLGRGVSSAARSGPCTH